MKHNVRGGERERERERENNDSITRTVLRYRNYIDI